VGPAAAGAPFFFEVKARAAEGNGRNEADAGIVLARPTAAQPVSAAANGTARPLAGVAPGQPKQAAGGGGLFGLGKKKAPPPQNGATAFSTTTTCERDNSATATYAAGRPEDARRAPPGDIADSPAAVLRGLRDLPPAGPQRAARPRQIVD